MNSSATNKSVTAEQLLHVACILKSIVIAISFRDENHLTPLLLAARLDHYQTIVMLLDHGAKIGTVSKNKVKQYFIVIQAMKEQ